jgi:hypothetical protein
MHKRLRTVGALLVAIGLAFMIGGGVALSMINDGYDSLEAFSEAQNVVLTYNEDGELTDRGTTEGADAILELLTVEWGFPLVDSHMDPNDPLVNTQSEYMYQMATVGYHVLHGTQTVVLEEDVEYNGELFEAGTYEFDVDGRYWTDFDRQHPIEAVARGQAWTGTVHGLFGELGVGTVTASTLQLGLGVTALIFGLGATFIIAGAGLIWASRDETAPAKASVS